MSPPRGHTFFFGSCRSLPHNQQPKVRRLQYTNRMPPQEPARVSNFLSVPWLTITTVGACCMSYAGNPLFHKARTMASTQGPNGHGTEAFTPPPSTRFPGETHLDPSSLRLFDAQLTFHQNQDSRIRVRLQPSRSSNCLELCRHHAYPDNNYPAPPSLGSCLAPVRWRPVPATRVLSFEFAENQNPGSSLRSSSFDIFATHKDSRRGRLFLLQIAPVQQKHLS